MKMDVARLRIAEDVRIKVDALSLLQGGQTADGTHDALERAVVEVAERMGAVEQAMQMGNLASLVTAAAGLGDLGEQLGFVLLTRVARDTVICAERRDLNAVHAVSERLIRVGDATLAAAIDGATMPD